MPRYCCVNVCLVTSVMSNSLRPYGPWPARLFCPWDSPGKNTGVGCHFLLPGITILLQRSRCVSNEQLCLKAAGLYIYMMIFYFYLVCFTFSISYLVLPFHLVYIFQFLCLLLFFLKPLSNMVEKLLYTYINMYFRKFRNLF